MVESSSSGTTFKLDVVRFAKDLMAEVDSIRSYLPNVGDDSQQAENKPTESRVNAFFRLIGLPMIVSITPRNDKDKSATKASESTLTPGFAQGGQPDGIVADSKDATMDHPITGKVTSLQSLLAEREKGLLDLERKNGTPERDNRRIQALYFPMDLTLDEDGMDDKGFKVFKRVSPFVTSYMAVYPMRNELSKPFLADPENGRPPPDSTPIRRPFIETVLRIRLITLEGGNQAQEDYLKAARERIAQLSSEAANLLPQDASTYEAFIIDQMLGSIDAFADMWVNLQRRRERLAKDSTFVLKPKTSSAKTNASGKQGNIATELQLTDKSSIGRRMAALDNSVAVSEAMISLLPTQDVASLNGDTVKNVMPNALTNPFVSMLRQPIEWQRKKLAELQARLDSITQAADRLRFELEMMTGEFSGLSLPDVVFTILGLFLVDREDLIGMLDASTLDQMKKDSALETALEQLSGTQTTTAVGNLRDKVESLYDVLAAAVEKRLNRNKRTSKNSVPLAGEAFDPYNDVNKTLSDTKEAIEGTSENGG